MFFQQFATLAQSGLSILATLEHLQNRTHNSYLNNVIQQLRAAAQNGQSLYSVMQEHETYFGKFATVLFKSGELDGHLPENAQAIADYLEENYKNLNRILVGLAYPVALLHMAIFLIPLGIVFSSGTGGGAPAYIKLVLTCLVGLYGTLAIIYFLYKLIKSKAKYLIDSVKIVIPVTGKLSRNISIYRFITGFSALYKAGVNAADCWQVSAELTDNTVFEDKAMAAWPLIRTGKPLSEAFTKADIFPAEVVDMLRTGEAGGNIDGMLEKAGQYITESNKRTIGILIRILPLAVYFLVAAVIVFFIVSFYLRYFAAMDAILGN